jgi:hypothetical protein
MGVRVVNAMMPLLSWAGGCHVAMVWIAPGLGSQSACSQPGAEE